MNHKPLLLRSSWAALALGLSATPLVSSSDEMVFPGETWETATPESQGVDTALLLAAVGYLEGICGSDGVSQVLIIRRGRVIWQGPHIDSRHNVWSCTKSFGSLAAGLLIDDGKLTPQTRLADILPEYAERYPELTIGQCLSQTDGYVGEAGEPWKPLEPRFAPGTRFHYGGSNALTALARALTEVAGEPLEELVKRRLAGPIGYNRAFEWGDWGVIDDHKVNGIGGGSLKGVFTNARNLARLGHLLLNRGRWEDRQLISEAYLDEATRVHFTVDLPPFDPDGWYASIQGAYGYLFWLNGIRPDGERLWRHAPASAFALQGNRNNLCCILPDWEMVVVRMGTDTVIPMEQYDTFFELLGRSLKDG